MRYLGATRVDGANGTPASNGQILTATGTTLNAYDWASPSTLAPVVKTAAYTAVASDYVLANAASGGFTVTLPASPSTGQTVGVKKTDSSANVVTVVATGKTIDGDANATLVAKDAACLMTYDGANWFIRSGYADATSGSSTVTPPNPYYVSGNYYDPRITVAVTSANALTLSAQASTSYFVPQYIFQALTINEVGMLITTAAGTAGTINISLYNPTSAGKPGTLLSNFGTISQGSTGYKGITGLSLTVQPGWYFWLVSNSVSAPAVASITAATSFPMAGTTGTPIAGPPTTGYTQTGITTPPSPATPVVSVAANQPIVYFKVA